MNFRGAAELLSGDDKAMQANNLAGMNEYAANPWPLIPSGAPAHVCCAWSARWHDISFAV